MLTARDRFATGGGVSSARTRLTVEAAAGPFAVTSQATPGAAAGNTATTVEWSVAQTNVAPVSVANVQISYSTDGGLTFPTVVEASTPNDGSQSVTVPNVATTQGRFKVEAVGNYFFDVSDGNLMVTPGSATPTSTPTATATATPSPTATGTATTFPTAQIPTVQPPLTTTWLPVLDRVARRGRAKRSGRLRLRLSCTPKLAGAQAPSVCSGTLRLTANLGTERRRIAGRRFTLPVGAEKVVQPKLTGRARRALPLRARLTAAIGTNVSTTTIRIRLPR